MPDVRRSIVVSCCFMSRLVLAHTSLRRKLSTRIACAFAVQAQGRLHKSWPGLPICVTVARDTKELLVGLSEEDKREMVSFMGSVSTKARNALQVRVKQNGLSKLPAVEVQFVGCSTLGYSPIDLAD